jgi:hypothetical protein
MTTVVFNLIEDRGELKIIIDKNLYSYKEHNENIVKFGFTIYDQKTISHWSEFQKIANQLENYDFSILYETVNGMNRDYLIKKLKEISEKINIPQVKNECVKYLMLLI